MRNTAVGIRGLAVVMLVALGLGGVTRVARAEELRGADRVLGLLKDELAAAPVPSEVGALPAAVLAKDVAAFRKERDGLPADEAARGWLGLFDRLWALSPAAFLGGGGSEEGEEGWPSPAAGGAGIVPEVLAALPPPAAWPTLRDLAFARKPEGGREKYQASLLRLLTCLLTGDPKAAAAQAQEIRESAYLRDLPQRDFVFSQLSTLEAGFRSAGSGERSAGVRFEALVRGLQAAHGGQPVLVTVPDLVGAVGEEKAGELLLKALRTPGARLTVPSGGPTLALAKRVALEHADELSWPQWGLVTSPADADLFAVLESRFPEVRPDSGADQSPEPAAGPVATDYDRARAEPCLVLGLATTGRLDEAVARASKMPLERLTQGAFEQAWSSLDLRRSGPLLLDFLGRFLSERPEAPLWPSYVSLSLQLGGGEEARRRIEAALGRRDLAPEVAFGLRDALATALFASGEEERAVGALREAVRLAVEAGFSAGPGRSDQRPAVVDRLCRVGLLLKRPELVSESVEASRRILPDPAFAALAGGPSWSPPALLDALLEGGEYAAAESLLVESLKPVVRGAPAGPYREVALATGALKDASLVLSRLYHAAGRDADALTLLEEGPWWGASDLSALAEMLDPALSVAAAGGLRARGRGEEAVAILKHHLYAHPEDDKAYAPLADLSGAALLPWLDELYARDRFEERPLIWKAEILRREKRLPEAEAVVREALRVDPTDGEQPRGDRVRGYAVLARVLKEQGKDQDAAFFDKVVQSVRVAEQGDAFAQVGLLRRSLSLYGEAEAAFTDAYCVQWRLAERYHALGDEEQAKKHYEIAFERMPEQFGQVASFCFGCEGVFRGTGSRDAAERVLGRLAESMPEKPQVHFLLGELRAAQGRQAEAYRHYRRAAELDPGYLDAWKKAYSLAESAELSPAERDEVVLRMLRLDPLRRHLNGAPQIILDFKGLWQVAKDAQRFAVPPPQELLPLPASRRELDRLKKIPGAEAAGLLTFSEAYRLPGSAPLEPGAAVAGQPPIEAVQLLLMTSMANGW